MEKKGSNLVLMSMVNDDGVGKQMEMMKAEVVVAMDKSTFVVAVVAHRDRAILVVVV